MDQNHCPIYTKGSRNVFCPYYSDCLDHAIKNSWEYWSCSDCQQKRKRKVPADILLSSSNADPYYSLSPSLNGKVRNYSL